jgi:hypothetical protein
MANLKSRKLGAAADGFLGLSHRFDIGVRGPLVAPTHEFIDRVRSPLGDALDIAVVEVSNPPSHLEPQSLGARADPE